MKKLFLLLCVLSAALVPVQADTISAYLTLTNNPAVSNTLNVNGVIRTFTNNTANNIATWLQTTSSIPRAATNVFNHVNTYGFTNVNQVTYTNATNLLFEGISGMPLTIIAGGSWGVVTYTTNVEAASYYAVLPLFGGNDASQWTNIHKDFVDMLNYTNGSNHVNISAPAFTPITTQLLNTSNALQTQISALGPLIAVAVVNNDVNNVDETTFVLADGGGTYFWHINWNDGFDGATNPDLISRIGATETLPNKTLTAPTINGGTINSATLTTPTLTSPIISGATFADGFKNLGATNITNAVQAAQAPAETVLLWNPIGGGVGPAKVVEITQPRSGATGSRKWNFGLYEDAGLAYSADIETIARLGDLNTASNALWSALLASDNVASNGVLAKVVARDAGSATNTALKTPTITGGTLSLLTTNSGAMLQTPGTISTLAAGGNVMERITNDVIFIDAPAGAYLDAIAHGFGTGDHFRAIVRGNALTVRNESGFITTNTEFRIVTADGAALTLPVSSLNEFTYDTSVTRWRVALLYPALATATNVVILDVGQTNSTHASSITTNNTAGVPQLKSISAPSFALSLEPTNNAIDFTSMTNGMQLFALAISNQSWIALNAFTNSVAGLTNLANSKQQGTAAGSNLVAIPQTFTNAEANVNGEVNTNATKLGLVYDKAGVTNRLRSVQAGNGLGTTNESTNIVFALTDPNLLPLQVNNASALTNFQYGMQAFMGECNAQVSLAANTASFAPITGVTTLSTDALTRGPIGRAGTISNLFAKATGSAGALASPTTNFVFRIYTNGIAGPVAATASGNGSVEIFGTDTANAFYFGGGTNQVSMMISNTSASTVSLRLAWAFEIYQ